MKKWCDEDHPNAYIAGYNIIGPHVDNIALLGDSTVYEDVEKDKNIWDTVETIKIREKRSHDGLLEYLNEKILMVAH